MSGTAVVDRVGVAREALLEITRPSDIGDLISETVGDDGVTTVLFGATMLGYPGWRWTVSVAQLDGDEPTVLEAELMPGDGALVAPDWVPWSTRLEEWQAQQSTEGDDGAGVEGEAAESDDDEDLDEDKDLDDDDDLDEDEDDLDEDDADAGDLGDDVYDGLDPEAAIGDDDDDEQDDGESDDDPDGSGDDDPFDDEPASDAR